MLRVPAEKTTLWLEMGHEVELKSKHLSIRTSSEGIEI